MPAVTHVPTGGDRSDIGAVEEHTPSVAGVLPGAGGPGTRVLIGGTGFTGGTEVLIGKKRASSFTVLSDSVIVANAPTVTGQSDVRVVTPLGESPVASVDRFGEPSVSHAHKPKRKRRTLDPGLELLCPAGGKSCAARITATLHGKRIGKGKLKSVRAGGSAELKLKPRRWASSAMATTSCG